MFDIRGDDNGANPKCFFTHVRLPQHIARLQPPTKKKPFSCILDRHFFHTIDVLSENDTVNSLDRNMRSVTDGHHYAKVHMKLLNLVEGDFFNIYIKQGNIIMLSQGKAGVDNLFSLSQGILRLELDRPTYERAGLQGKPIPSPGKKHTKYRYLIKLNLRLPSMVRGRPGFNRLLYAFQNVLTDSVTWLFHDLSSPSLDLAATPAPAVAAFHPVLKEPATSSLPLPSRLIPTDPTALEAEEWLEHLSLLLLGSPLLRAESTTDPTLARYSLPTDVDTSATDLTRLRTRGFFPPSTTSALLTTCINAAREKSWAVFRAQSFDGSTTTVHISNGEARIWEYTT